MQVLKTFFINKFISLKRKEKKFIEKKKIFFFFNNILINLL
jgi:hypothetical protein